MHRPNRELIAAVVRRRLRAARKAAGLKQATVAARLGVSQSFVASCESGARPVSAIEIAEFAWCYGRPEAWFFGDDREGKPQDWASLAARLDTASPKPAARRRRRAGAPRSASWIAARRRELSALIRAPETEALFMRDEHIIRAAFAADPVQYLAVLEARNSAGDTPAEEAYTLALDGLAALFTELEEEARAQARATRPRSASRTEGLTRRTDKKPGGDAGD